MQIGETTWTFILAGGAVTWSSKRQSTVAASSTEAEYVAMAYATKEALWLVRVISQFEELRNITINCDNQSAMAVASREAFSARTKHIDVSHHFIRQHVASGLIVLKYVPTDENVADCLTKAVGKNKMTFGSNGFGLVCANDKTLETIFLLSAYHQVWALSHHIFELYAKPL